MPPFTRKGAAHALRGLRLSLATTSSHLEAWLAVARAWRWGAVVGRVVLAALGLLLLGVIGRSAFARNVLMTESLAESDAGPHSIPSASAVVASPSPPTPSAAPLVPSAGAPLATSSAVPTDNTAPVAAAPSPASARGRATPDDPVYLNEATAADLHRLPGVGPKRAEAILALRARLGHFRQVEDLLKVKGIGRSSLRKLRPLIRLDPPPAKSTDAGAIDGRAALYDSAPFTRAMSAPTPPSFRSMCS